VQTRITGGYIRGNFPGTKGGDLNRSSMSLRTLIAIVVMPVALCLTSQVSGASPTSSPQALLCQAHVSNSHPHQYTNVTVFVRTVKFAHVTTAAHYKTTTTTKTTTANSAGAAAVVYRISRATKGYFVRVIVSVKSGTALGHCSTGFTPI
jgi:hypothetical protein